MPELEVIRRRRPRGHRRVPLVFVHGGHFAAWCWDEHFLAYFAEHGFDCHALSLRGHGGSAGRERLSLASLDDYVEDVAQVVAGLDAPPVLIGHSMGGAVVQRYAQAHPVRAIALLASVPPRGLLDSAIDLWRRNPALLTEIAWVQSGQGAAASLERVGSALFARDMPVAKARRYLVRMQAESQRALFDLSAMHWYARPRALDIPVLVLGGAQDGLFGPETVQATAAWFDTEPVLLPGLGHTMMLDERWEDAAAALQDWIDAALD